MEKKGGCGGNILERKQVYEKESRRKQLPGVSENMVYFAIVQ